MNPILKAIIAILLGVVIFWLLGWLGLPQAIALVAGVIAGLVYFLYGR